MTSPTTASAPPDGSATLPSRTPATTPAREAVTTAIRRAVLVGDLKPGDKLTEVRLAASLDVSRATLREALNLLVQDGLLVQEPYRGFSVASLGPDDLRDIAQTRAPLDLIAVHGILADPTGRRRRLLVEAWEAYDALAYDPDPTVAFEAHLAFHHGLWAASENSMLLRLWPVTEAVTTLMVAQDQALHPDPSRAPRLHRHLVDAILSGELAEIERLLHAHIVAPAEELMALQGPGHDHANEA